jgi:hydroxylaminobenzene mutase
VNIEVNDTGKKLIFFGAVLFLLGLLQGGLIPHFLNSRMALSAHLAAVQSGMALMIFGLLWGLIALQQKWLSIAYYSGVASMYLVWIAISLAAAVGASKALPQAGAGFAASPFAETLVELVVTVGAGLGVISSVLIVVGLYRGLGNSHA